MKSSRIRPFQCESGVNWPLGRLIDHEKVQFAEEEEWSIFGFVIRGDNKEKFWYINFLLIVSETIKF